MGMVDGSELITWEGGLFDPDGELLPRVRWAFNALRTEGVRILLNEAGRPYGVPSDRYATSSGNTQSGRSTVWYQWGRFLRGETPSAANPAAGPYASEHTQGLAIDSNTDDMAERARVLRLVGMIRTIPSETWHSAIRYDSQVDTSAYAGGAAPTPEDEDFTMADVKAITDLLGALLTTIATADDATKVATVVRNYAVEAQNTVATALIYPDGSAVKLSAADDVDAAVVAHAVVYGLKPTNELNAAPRDRFGSQLSPAQWDAFWAHYPGPKIGF